MQELPTISTSLEALFPVPAASYISTRPNDSSLLLEEGLPGIDAMRPARKLEFSHGRHCARTALSQLGLLPQAIPQGANREPVWPSDILGSISHSRHIAAAVVAHNHDFDGLGLDIESAAPLDEKLIAMVCRSDEGVDGDGLKAKLLFSIKESVYKCIYPLARQYIDFQQVRILLNDDQQSFKAHADSPHYSEQLMARLEGRYNITGGVILSGSWLKR